MHIVRMGFYEITGDRMVPIIWIDSRKQDIGLA